MSFDPMYPSKILILDAARKVSGTTTNFTCQLDKSYVNSEGNFQCRVIDILIDQVLISTTTGTLGNIYPTGGIPEYLKGFLGVKSNLSMNSTIVGTTDERNSSSNLNGLIGYGLVTSEVVGSSSSIVTDRDKFGRSSIKSLNNSWVQCRAPNGMVSVQLVDNNGLQIATSKNYTGYTAPSARDQTINNVIIVVEVKQVNALQETMNQIKARRTYQIP